MCRHAHMCVILPKDYYAPGIVPMKIKFLFLNFFFLFSSDLSKISKLFSSNHIFATWCSYMQIWKCGYYTDSHGSHGNDDGCNSSNVTAVLTRFVSSSKLNANSHGKYYHSWDFINGYRQGPKRWNYVLQDIQSINDRTQVQAMKHSKSYVLGKTLQ